MNARIASLEAKENVIYAGLENGIILCIQCTEMCVTHTFGAYNKTVRSLIMLRPPNQSSKKPTEHHHPQHNSKQARTYHLVNQRKPPPNKLKLYNVSPQNRRKLVHSNSLYKQSFDLSPISFKVNSSYKTTENLLLISIGRGYEGIVGSHTNHPQEFILPSATVSELQSKTQTAKPDPDNSYLLIWSTEKCGGEEEEDTEIEQESFEDSMDQSEQ